MHPKQNFRAPIANPYLLLFWSVRFYLYFGLYLLLFWSVFKITKIPLCSNRCTKVLTNKDFPKITRRCSNSAVIALQSWLFWSQHPVICPSFQCGENIQPIFISSMPPFPNVLAMSIKSPVTAHSCQFPVVILRVYLGVRTCELFLYFVAIVRVGVYNVDFFVFFVLRHW